ncbi:MAG: NAD(+)/NADH kinase [Eggerthellaceae bacterium]|nr:NAD(+)/NADH kinase [Eggerthellaceae bacterium]
MFIAIVRNNSNPQALDGAMLLGTYLTSQNIDYQIIDSLSLGNAALRALARDSLKQDPDLVVVLGGDGTILETVHLFGPSCTPILGINFGRLGFLANGSVDGIIPMVAAALADEAQKDVRACLSIQIICDGDVDPYASDGASGDDSKDGSFETEDEIVKDDEACFINALETGIDEPNGGFGINRLGICGAREFFALNELAITRGAMGRVIDFDLSISDSHIARLRGDGLVVATATGSTGYALSAGGPVIAPGFDGLVVVPLAPHTLLSRAIVTAEHDVVEITLDDKDSFRQSTIFIDGELYLFDEPVKKIYIRRHDQHITLLRADGSKFYERIANTFFQTDPPKLTEKQPASALKA